MISIEEARRLTAEKQEQQRQEYAKAVKLFLDFDCDDAITLAANAGVEECRVHIGMNVRIDDAVKALTDLGWHASADKMTMDVCIAW